MSGAQNGHLMPYSVRSKLHRESTIGQGKAEDVTPAHEHERERYNSATPCSSLYPVCCTCHEAIVGGVSDQIDSSDLTKGEALIVIKLLLINDLKDRYALIIGSNKAGTTNTD